MKNQTEIERLRVVWIEAIGWREVVLARALDVNQSAGSGDRSLLFACEAERAAAEAYELARWQGVGLAEGVI